MLSAQQNKVKGIMDIPDHLYGQYARLRSLLEYTDLAQTFSVDATDFLSGLRSTLSVFKKNNGLMIYASMCVVRQTFEFKGFKLHADHTTILNLDSQNDVNLNVETEGLGTTFSIDWEDGSNEVLGGHVGLSLYDCISKNTHQMLPSENQLKQLKTTLLYGLCEQYDCKPSQIYQKLNNEFSIHSKDLDCA